MSYTHPELFHNNKQPKKIVPLIVDILKPRSVLDVGCGLGNFCAAYLEAGVEEVLGIDGHWVDATQRRAFIDDDHFITKDLSHATDLGRRFELVQSLEVIEHVDKQYEDNFLQTLVNHGKVIVFSAAAFSQGGQSHVNEQWPSYWQKKFEKLHYRMHDVLRGYFWHDETVEWWYSQNIFLVVHESVEAEILKKFADYPLRPYTDSRCDTPHFMGGKHSEKRDIVVVCLLCKRMVGGCWLAFADSFGALVASLGGERSASRSHE